MEDRSPHSDEFAAGRQWEEWLAGWSPTSLYIRWYLRHRPARELPYCLTALGDGPLGSVLDVGCALGVYLAEMYRLGHGRTLLAGVDVGTSLIAEAQARLATVVDDGTMLDLRVATASSLPFADGTFDVVMCNGVAKYLDAPAFARYVSEAYRVLRPGGRMCVSEFTPATGARAEATAKAAGFVLANLRTTADMADVLCSGGFVGRTEYALPRLRRFPWGNGGVAGSRPSA